MSPSARDEWVCQTVASGRERQITCAPWETATLVTNVVGLPNSKEFGVVLRWRWGAMEPGGCDEVQCEGVAVRHAYLRGGAANGDERNGGRCPVRFGPSGMPVP